MGREYKYANDQCGGKAYCDENGSVFALVPLAAIQDFEGDKKDNPNRQSYAKQENERFVSAGPGSRWWWSKLEQCAEHGDPFAGIAGRRCQRTWRVVVTPLESVVDSNIGP